MSLFDFFQSLRACQPIQEMLLRRTSNVLKTVLRDHVRSSSSSQKLTTRTSSLFPEDDEYSSTPMKSTTLPGLTSTRASVFPDDYSSAQMKSTSLPGPASQVLLKQLDAHQQSGAIHFFVDYAASKGNYIVDVDGNRYLDILGQIASLPLGYNHPRMIEKITDPSNLAMLVQRPCLGILPPSDWHERVSATLLKVAPAGLSHVQTMMCGSCSNENAFKAAFMWHQTNVKRKGLGPTPEDLATCMTDATPGSPQLAVMSFTRGFHGRTLGCLAATHSKAIHKVDIPSFPDWPVAPFPQLQYPLSKFKAENEAEEQRCLAEIEACIVSTKTPIAAMIIEPIQAEGGDRHASAQFFRQLRDLAAKHQIVFIVDEVQTGGGSTGTFWAHEHWGLDNPPDIVTFSKKMQTGGYYAKPEFRPTQAYRIFNTWMGDPAKMLSLEAFLEVVEEDQLLENVRTTGAFFQKGLERLEAEFEMLNNVRGVGTYLAFDCPSSDARDDLIQDLRLNGVEAGGSGDVSIRFRPALVFGPRHAQEFLTILENILRSR